MPKYQVMVTKIKTMTKVIQVTANDKSHALERARSQAMFQEEFDEQGACSATYDAKQAIEI